MVTGGSGDDNTKNRVFDYLTPNMDATSSNDGHRYNNNNITNRPLSVYDNLSSSTTNGMTQPSAQHLGQSSTDCERSSRLQSAQSFSYYDRRPNHEHLRKTGNKFSHNENEYPISRISFKFDDLPHQQQKLDDSTASNMTNDCHNSQGYRHQANNNNNYNKNNNHNINVNNNTPVMNATSNDRMNSGCSTGIGDNFNRSGIGSNNICVNSDNKNVKLVGTTAQYENVSETVRLRNSNLQNNRNKPVISDAKSSFFGLAQTPTSASPHAMPANKYQITNNNNDRVPLITVTHNANNNLVTPTKLNVEYQNIPTNSACYLKSLSSPLNASTVSDTSMRDYGNDHMRNMSARSISPHQYQDVYDTSGGGDGGGDGDGGATSNSSKHFMEANKRVNEPHPSQAVYMTTTVPQNIKGSNIAGRHTPTRSSLRHSRMIVVNKNYQAPRKPNPLKISHPFLAKLLLIFQIIIGFCITSLALWILLWAPSTRTRDNPYWSGLTLLLAGILGLILVEFKRIPRQKVREHCFTFIRFNSTTISVLAVVVSFAAFLFAALHLDNITSEHTRCMPANIFTTNAACICLFGGANTTSHLEIRTAEEGEVTAGGFEFQYRDLNCSEVSGAWKYILITSTVLNMLGFMLSFLYMVLLCFPERKSKRNNNATSYAPVQSRL